jgi:excisionase family DNA binding protein
MIGPSQQEAPMEILDNNDPAPAPVLAVRPNEACRIVGIGRTTLYELVSAKKLRLVKIGRASVIPMDDLRRLIAEAA